MLARPDVKKDFVNYTDVRKQHKKYEVRYTIHNLDLATMVFALKSETLTLWGKVNFVTNNQSLKYIFATQGTKYEVNKMAGVD